MKIVWLHEAAAREPDLVGEKAAALARLTDRCAVPVGFILTAMDLPEGEELPTEVALRLADAYTHLARRLGSPAPAVAVRQRESYLNLAGLEAVTQAVRRCLAMDAQMPVLVQQFILADASGVAFSINPETGDWGEVLIQAAWGLGDGPAVTPDSYRVVKGGSILLESRVAEKGRMSVAVPGGTEEVDTPQFLRREPALFPEQVQAVAGLAASLESELGCPVDLAFTYAENRLFLLRCRPMAGVDPAAAQLAVPIRREPPPDFPVTWQELTDGEKYWTAVHTHQVLPLYASFLSPWVAAWEQENQVISYQFRRINTYLYQYSYRRPNGPRSEERPFLGAQQLQALWQSEILPELQGQILQLASMDLTTVPRQVLRAQLDEIVGRYVQIYELHWRIVRPVEAALEQFRTLYAELFPGAGLDHLPLLQGFHNKSLETSRALWQLAQALGDLAPLVREGTAEEVVERLRVSPAGQAWLEQFTACLERYGRRFAHPDWTRPSWLEEPTPVLEAVRACLAAARSDPGGELERAAAQREDGARAARRRLAGYPYPVRERFEAALRAAQTATIMQEDHDFWIDHRCMYEIRRALLTLGRRLAAGGLIDSPEAIWYLTLDELKEVTSDTPVFSLRALVAQRREEMARWAGTKPPAQLGTRPPGTPS